MLYPFHPPFSSCHLDLDSEPRTSLASKGQGIWGAFRGYPYVLALVFHEGRDSEEDSPNMFKGTDVLQQELGRTRMEERVGSCNKRQMWGPL